MREQIEATPALATIRIPASQERPKDAYPLLTLRADCSLVALKPARSSPFLPLARW